MIDRVRAGALGRALPYLFLSLSLCGFQLGATIAKPMFDIVGAQGASALRLGMAAVMLAVVFRPWRVPIDGRLRWLLLGYGLGLAGLNLFFFMALRTIPLGVTVALEFLGPLGLAIATSRRRLDFVWAVLAGIGIFLLMPLRGLSAGLDPVGVAFALLSASCWAGYIVCGQKTGSALPSHITAAIGVAIAALVVLPFGVARAGTDLLRGDVLLLGLTIALVSGSLPYVLDLVAMRSLPTRVFGILMSLEPAVGALFGFVILGQKITALQGAAIAAIMAASAGIALTQTSPAPSPVQV